jgi:hypothetical protein
MSEHSWVHLEFDRIIRETDKALYVLFANGEEHWIPLSQIEDGGADYRAGDKDGSMCVTEWIAKQKGMA